MEVFPKHTSQQSLAWTSQHLSDTAKPSLHTQTVGPRSSERCYTQKPAKALKDISPSAGDSDCFVFFPAAFNRLMMFVYEVKCT